MSDVTVKILQQIREDIALLSSQTNARFDQMDKRFDRLETRVEGLERTVSGHGTRLEHIEGAIVALLNLIGTMHKRLDTHEELLERRT